MKKPYRAVLIVSIVGNVALTGALMYGHYVGASATTPSKGGAAGTPVALSPAIEQADRANTLLNARQIKEIYSKLGAAGIPDAIAKRMLVGYLSEESRKAIPYQYWRPTALREMRERLAQREANESNRAAVTEALGTDAAEDPSFRTLYRPYEREFPFLGPAKQRELEAVAANRDQTLITAFQGGGESQIRPVSQRAQADMTAQLQKLLTPEEFFEYGIRTSPVSHRMLESGFEFSEDEFRAVYRAIGSSPQSLGSEAARLTPVGPGMPLDPTMGRIKSALGDRRFAEYAKRQDPTYRVLEALSQSYGIRASAVDEAYQTIIDTAATVARIQRSGPIPAPEQSQELHDRVENRDTKLKQLLGQQAFETASRSLPMLASQYPVPLATPFPGATKLPFFQSH
jgi:hypothetical protein